MVEQCFRTQKTLVNPIIDWEDEDVWQFLNDGGYEHCELYDKGKTRIGCIGCPMNTAAAAELEEYPKYKENYLKAFARMLKRNDEKGLVSKCNWKTPEDVYRWWMKLDGEEDGYPGADASDC
jgi:phosphoadenosine phosphosulfate reductase